MNLRLLAEQVFARIPVVRQPQQHIPFKRKIMWTVAVVVLYFIMTNIPIYGMAAGSEDMFGQFRSVLAGEQGSILQLGIMPIVTASIVLQILAGTNTLPLDLNDPRDQQLYQGLRRFLIIAMVIINGFPLVFAGDFLLPSSEVASQLGLSITMIQFLMFAQITFGGIFIYYLDQLISKWGIGSGIGLFIIAGVSQRFVGGVFSEMLPGWWTVISGQADLAFSSETAQVLLIGEGHIIPLLTTVIIFSIIVYAESTRVEIPVKNARVGTGGRFPVKLIYASVLPIILVRAVQANVQFIGRMFDSQLGAAMPTWLGHYTADGEAIGGLFYYLTPIYAPQDWMWWLGTTTAEPYEIAIRLMVDMSWMVIGGAIFAVFWVRTTGMDAEATAQQIYQSGMEIPGFRRHPQQIERVLDRYIPYVTVVGGALIGGLAVIANMLGTIGMVDGTGLLLAVSITYKLYEEIAEEIEKEMNPMLRKFF